MFSVGLSRDGDVNKRLYCNIFQLIKLFPAGQFNLTHEDVQRRLSSVLPAGANPSDYLKIHIVFTMDPITKKFNRATILPTHQIFNNPNISITPSRAPSLPSPKQLSIAASSRPPWTVPVSPPVSIVPYEPDKSVLNCKETQQNSKRTAPYPISDRSIKKPRLSNPTKTLKDSKSIIPNQVLNHQKKKNDIIVSSIDAATSIPSTSNAIVIRSSQEVTCVHSSNEELLPSNPELNCQDNSSHLNIKKNEDGILKKYFFMTNNQFKFDDTGNKSATTNSNQTMLRIQTKNEMFEITRPEMMDELLYAVGMAMKKTVTKEELETLKQNSDVLQSPKLDWSSETKNVVSTSSKISPASHINISNSINQSNQAGVNKSQRQIINLKQPSKPTIKPSNVTKQQSTSTSSNISSKMQYSTNKQTGIKNHLSINQPKNNSLKQTISTTTQIQTPIKQKLNSTQLPMSSKHPMVVSTNKKVINPYQNVKPTATYQSSGRDVKKCIKCKAISDDEVCAACRMSSHLKNVTVTRIDTPSTSEIIAPESPVTTPIRPNDSPLSSINSVLPQESVVLLLSSGEEDEETLEPVITKAETKDAVKKHIDKLRLNPKLLEDKLWQKELSIKDYFKIEECHSVHIGSFRTVPVPTGDMLVCLYGIRMAVLDLELKPVTIDLQMDNVVKILGFYGENPLIIIYTNHLAAVGIQHLLNMNENDKKHLYDPLNKDAALNKIIWFFNSKRPELLHLEKLLLKLPKKKYATLTVNQAKILSFHKKDEEIKKLEKEEQEKADSKITILEDKLNERKTAIKVVDFKMLSSNEFVNDILIEFYMNYWNDYHLNDEDKKRTYIFSTYFYTTLTKSFSDNDTSSSETPSKIRHERVKKWTKNVNVFQKDFIFVPINENLHWFMAVICYPYLTGKVNMKDDTPVNAPDDHTGRYKLPPVDTSNADGSEANPNNEDLWLFDSSSTQNYFDKRGVDYETDVANYLKNRHILVKRPCILLFDSLSGGIHRARIAGTLREWLEHEYVAKYGKKKHFNSNNFKGSLVKVPQQPNYTDCGLFAVHYFTRFFERPIVDYTFPITHLENWFHIDEVAKNCKKRREIHDIILARMKVTGSVLPEGFELPTLNFTEPDVKIPQNPNYNQNSQYLQKSTQPSDVSNPSNRSNLPNHSNQAHNSPKPSTSHNQPKTPYHLNKFQNHVTRNNIVYDNDQYYDEHNEEFDEESIESIDEDVDRQFNINDHYDDGEFPQQFERVGYDVDLQSRSEFISEMAGGSIEQVDDEEGFGSNYREFNDFRSGSGSRRNVITISDENYQSFDPNNHNLSYNNDVDEYEIEDEEELEEEDEEVDEEEEEEDEDEGDAIGQIHRINPNHDINDDYDDEEDDYNEPNSTINHNRRDNHFNHNRLSN